MEFHEQTIDSFLELLSSKAAVPGGGGASALVGSVAASLSHMVAALTVGKAKYADVEGEMQGVLAESERITKRFLSLMDEDASAFAPLAEAYRLPKDTPEQITARTKIMEAALRTAVEPPLRIMEVCGEALELIAVCAEKGSVMAVSDAGVAATLCRAAFEGASLNVFINTQPMTDREYAERLNFRAKHMLAEYGTRAEELYKKVYAKLGA